MMEQIKDAVLAAENNSWYFVFVDDGNAVYGWCISARDAQRFACVMRYDTLAEAAVKLCEIWHLCNQTKARYATVPYQDAIPWEFLLASVENHPNADPSFGPIKFHIGRAGKTAFTTN